MNSKKLLKNLSKAFTEYEEAHSPEALGQILADCLTVISARISPGTAGTDCRI